MPRRTGCTGVLRLASTRARRPPAPPLLSSCRALRLAASGERDKGCEEAHPPLLQTCLNEILPLPQMPQNVGIDVKKTLRGWPNFPIELEDLLAAPELLARNHRLRWTALSISSRAM